MRRSTDRPRRRLNRERVCIIKPSSMGDVVHAMPILSALRGRWPSAHLSWVVNRPFGELLEGHRDLDELIVYDRGRRGWTAPVSAGWPRSWPGSLAADST